MRETHDDPYDYPTKWRLRLSVSASIGWARYTSPYGNAILSVSLETLCDVLPSWTWHAVSNYKSTCTTNLKIILFSIFSLLQLLTYLDLLNASVNYTNQLYQLLRWALLSLSVCWILTNHSTILNKNTKISKNIKHIYFNLKLSYFNNM